MSALSRPNKRRESISHLLFVPVVPYLAVKLKALVSNRLGMVPEYP